MSENSKPSDSNKRTIYFDYLRVFATLAVIILHVSGQNWSTAPLNSFNWQTFSFFNSIVRWGVPVFVMISGSLFLEREIPIKKIYSKYILRLLIAFFFWSCIYAFFESGSLSDRIIKAVTGHFHMWFILMIAGLYMCLPIIKSIVAKKENIKYFLILSAVFAFAIPQTQTIINTFPAQSHFGNNILRFINSIFSDINSLDIHMFLGFVSFFVLGYYLNTAILSKKTRNLVCILGIAGFIATVSMTAFISNITGEHCKDYLGNFTVNVALESIFIFVFFKHRKLNNSGFNVFMSRLSKYSFGAYLVHALIIDALDKLLGLNTLSFNPVLSVFIIVFAVSLVSYGISALLNHITFIKKYIV